MTDTRDAVDGSVDDRQVGSYDDLPESEVATVLQVPLLWSQQQLERPRAAAATHAAPPPAGARHRSGGRSAGGEGRHRATPAPARTAGVGADASLQPAKPSRRAVASTRAYSTTADGVREPLVHTLRIGLVSACLVLVACAAVLLAVATWLP